MALTMKPRSGPGSRLVAAGLLLGGIVLLQTTAVQGEITSVWAVNDGEKIYRFQDDFVGKNRNSVWDGSGIRLRGLYNEVLAFQVIVETDSRGAENVTIGVDPLRHTQTGELIGSAAPAGSGSAGSIEVFTEHYLNVEHPTPKGWFYGGPASAPSRSEGWIPDPLIPPDAIRGRGGFPVTIPSVEPRRVTRDHETKVLPAPKVQNQGFWVDLYLPRDRRFPAGLYRSTVRVLQGGALVADLALEVDLVAAFLPDENHSRVWLHTGEISPYFPGVPAEELERMVKFECHRHRIEAVGGFRVHGNRFDPELMDNYLPFLDGSAYAPEKGYFGPGIGEGETLFAIGMYGRSVLGDSQEDVRAEADRWVSWFEKNAPAVKYFWYLVDEPGESYYPWIKERAKWIHDNPGPGRRLPIFITRGFIPELSQDIDIWCNWNGVDLGRLPELRAQGKDYWFYNGFRPRYGAVLLEAEAVDFRVNAWAKYIHSVSTWFLWHGTHWTHNHSGPKGNLHQRVFSQPVTFSSWSGTNVNGDGIVFYPGRMPYYPDEDRGLSRLIGSIRLKNIRRGQQDYELMWLAEQKTGRERVLQIVGEVVPASFEADPEGPVRWSERGDDFDRAREALIDLLVN